MGYYTVYTLEASPWPHDLGQTIQEFGEMKWALLPDGSPYDLTRWDEHEADMKALSLRFPGVLFSLRGEGWSRGDFWVKHFRDGKMQVCKSEVIIPPFDPDLLE